MKKITIQFLAVVLGVFVAAKFVDGVNVAGLYTAIIVAVMLGILNVLVRPLLVALTLPITILTLGLFLLVLNGFLFYFVGTIVKGFEVTGFMPAILGACIVSLVSWGIQKLQ